MDFFLFLVLNGVLFLRPEELIPSIAGLQLYYWVICTNLVVSAPAVLKQLEAKQLAKNPVTVCVLGVLVTIVLSHLARFDFWSARMGGFEFLKVVLYFLLLMAVVNTKQRLVYFLAAVVLLTLSINTIAVLQYNGVIEIEALTTLMENDYDPETGETFQVARMRATGIFSDPNDLSMVIVASIVICIACMFAPQLGMGRLLLIAPTGFLLYALTLTQSRGGLLALLAGGGAMFYLRFGWKNAAFVAAVTIPAVLAIGSRQTDIAGAMTGGTGESRTELWAEGWELFKQSPLFGIGYKLFADEVGLVAHNSFVHSTTELGFFGGMFYLGMFAISGVTLLQVHRQQRKIADPVLRQLLPLSFAMLTAYAVSMLSLSRCYAVPTYLILGGSAAYLKITAPTFKLPSFSFSLLHRLVVAEMGMLGATYVFVRLAR